MKSIINGFLCISLLAFAAGCGKEKGGGGSGAGPVTNPISNFGGSIPADVLANPAVSAALTNVSAWYNSTTEGSKLLGVAQVSKYQQSSGASNQNCQQKTFLGIPYTYCSSSSSSSGTQTPISQSTVHLVQDGIVINAKGNAELNSVFNGTAGTLIGATQQGTVYRLDFLRSSDSALVSFVIDTGFHSALNPISKSEQKSTGIIYNWTTAYRLY